MIEPKELELILEKFAGSPYFYTVRRLADEIERLRAENAELRKVTELAKAYHAIREQEIAELRMELVAAKRKSGAAWGEILREANP